MPKYRIITFLFVAVISVTSFVDAFSQSNVLNLDICTNNCNKSFNLITENSGKFDVKIINSSGRTMAMPFFNKNFDAFDEISFNIDIKHWKPGNYLLIIENDKGKKSTRKLKINEKSI